MPRRAPYSLRWSSQSDSYEISGQNFTDLREIVPDSQAWWEWLDGIASFAFHSQSGAHYTARKEMIQGRGAYWYGYRSLHGRTVKRYLGRTADLSIARLEEIGEQFEGMQHSSDQSSSMLLTSRLSLPRLPLGLVERPRLLSRLDGWRAYKLTLLSAPAGFGKTTLVNAWLTERLTHHNISHMAWISLDASDNDPVRFWRTIISACQTWQEGIGKAALAQLLSLFQPPFVPVELEVVLTLLLNDLTSRVKNGILILDDYQAITEPRLHKAMAFFIEHLPATLHVVILARREPPLPLMQWRARGEVQEIHTADLRFSAQEAATFLQQATASTFTEETIIQLDRLLEGWAVGLRLLVLAGQMTQYEVERHLTALDERQRPTFLRHQLLDYFVSEVLHAQPEPLQFFLLQTSKLPRLTGPLCDAITGKQDSAALLETIERAGLFLEALDDTGAWYRYHTLFAEAMHSEASRRFGEEALCVLSLRASYWYEQHAMLAEAIETALQAHDAERAGLLIEQSGVARQFYELHTLRRWLEQIPDRVLHAHPALCLYRAVTLQFLQEEASPIGGVTARIEEMLQRAEEGWRNAGTLSWTGLVFAFRALIASLHKPSCVQEATEHARKALALLPKAGQAGREEIPPEWRIICLGIVGAAEMRQGRFDEARQLLQEALTQSRASDSQPFLREINLRLGEVYMAIGELHQAGEYYRLALSGAQEQEESERALLGLARISFEWNDPAAAEQQASEAWELARRRGLEFSEEVAYLQTLLRFAGGQTSAAQQQLAVLLARLQAVSTQRAQELLPDVLVLQARLQLTVDDYLAAQRCLTQLTQSSTELSFTQHIMVHILQARLQLAQGKADAAVHQLEHLLPEASAKRYTRGELEIEILLARAYMACGQKDEARRWILQALSLARVEGFMRVFLDEGKALIPLLRSLIPIIHEKALRSYGQTILRALARSAEARARSSAFDGLPLELLSPQEQRVLRLLVAGRSNREIASELVVSVNTVKDHIKHLYQKLGVSSRLEAYQAVHHLDQF
ncbi:MAG: hypothetical protein J2P36_00145 [Ktedonobacteraceae bacterium]|nr:hypothetical protein [Ktedonobacteraceae bacterium]